MITEKKPKVSVVVPVFNGEKTLSACLDSLMNMDFPHQDREILVVDNNSTDRTKEIISKYPVTYLFEPNQGRAWARNCGIKNAAADFVAFIDADCAAADNWLGKLLDGILADDQVAFGGGEILAYRQDTIFERYASAKLLLSQKVAVEGFYDNLPRVVTANAICRKTILEEIGCFDEDLTTSEDTEIGWRVSLSGYEIKFIPEAVVYHQYIATFREFCRHHFEYGLADGVFYQKYRSFIVPSMKNLAMHRFVCIAHQILFGLSQNLYLLFSKAEHMDPLLRVVDILRAVVHFSGWTLASLRESVYGERIKQPSKIPLDAFFDRTLSVRCNGTWWTLDCPATWFLNNDRVKMIAHEDFHTYVFNATGTKIWLSLLETKDLEKTKDEVASFYGIPRDVAVGDVDDFMMMLQKEGIFKKDSVPRCA